MEGKRKSGRSKQRYKETIEKDLKWCGLDQVDKEDRVQWKNLVAVEIQQRPAPERTTTEKGERETKRGGGLITTLQLIVDGVSRGVVLK